jgi:hypothetical protein
METAEKVFKITDPPAFKKVVKEVLSQLLNPEKNISVSSFVEFFSKGKVYFEQGSDIYKWGERYGLSDEEMSRIVRSRKVSSGLEALTKLN